MKAAAVWLWARRGLLGFLILAAGMVFGFQALQHEESARLDRQELDEAQRCVSAWQAREDIRDMNETSFRRNAATLLSFARDPERAAAYEATVERDVIEIRSALPNPDCDLEASERRLEQG